MPDVIVFAGPSLPERPSQAWRNLLDRVEVRPPAQRGDFLIATSVRPRTIVLVDGYYYTVPSVTHKEVLYALDSGIQVIGAASMGALRAAELSPFGMRGVGQVYDWYSRGTLEGDDEVAILHAPGTFGYRAATVALVEVRAALQRLVARGEASEARARALIRALKDRAFSERDRQRVAHAAREALGQDGDRLLLAELGRRSVKQDDARRAIAAALAPARPRQVVPGATTNTPRARLSTRHLPTTNFLGHYREWYLRVDPAHADAPQRRTFMKAWFMVQLLHDDAPRLVAALRRRFVLASAATEAGLAAPDREVRALAGRLRAYLQRGPARARLPELELFAEAREHLLAQRALARWGNVSAACASLAPRLGLATEDAEDVLLRLAAMQDDSVPSWGLARAAAFSPTLAIATEVADLGGAVFAAFRAWSGPRGIAPLELRRLAATLWRCSVRATPREAEARALLRSHVTHGFVAGFEGAIEIIAAAERLKEPVNDYPAARARLRATPLGHVLGIPGAGDRALRRPRATAV